MEEVAEPKEVNKIQTFVFFDLESTGLFRKTPRIVELSMIAVSRAHLLEMRESSTVSSTPSDAVEQLSSSQVTGGHTTSNNSESTDVQRKNAVLKLPRVVHKYTRLYYPWKLVPPSVEEVNGLSNYALDCLPGFTEASAQALILFLDLPKPVSLVAHNGNKFDFPLLMAELTKVGCVDKFLDLQCTDSLCAIKDIDALIEREDITEITKLAESFSLDDELLCEEFIPSKRQRLVESDEERDNQVTHSPSLSHESTSHTGRNKDIDALIEMEVIKEITKLAESFSIDDLHDELLCEEFISTKWQRSIDRDEEKDNQVNHSPSRSHESTCHTGRGIQHTMEVSAQPLLTPVKSHYPGKTYIPATPSKPAHPPPQHYTPEASQPGTPGTSGLCARVTKESSKVRRTLTYDNDSKRKFGAKLSYAQSNIYRRLFDSEYMAHRAESDCQALLTICGHYGNKFVEWADTFATRFSNAKPMWVKRKSFSTNKEV